MLTYTIGDGFGPEELWPQPQDNEEYLALWGIERRPFQEELHEPHAAYHWLVIQPVEFLIVRLIRFYNTDTWRRPKQLLFVTSSLLVPILYLLAVLQLWSWFWTIDSLIGIKVVGLAYLVGLSYLFVVRY